MLDDALGLGDLEGQSRAHSNLGVAHHLLGDAGSRDDYLAALDHYRQARLLDARLGRRLSDSMTAANMAQIHVRSGNDLEARQLIQEAISLVRQVEGTSTLLFCALAEADRRLTNGDVTSALELIGAVRSHPAITSDSEAEIERILGRAGLPADEIEHGLALGAGQDFDSLIDRLTQDLET
jgi:tetratricopeptide (TPR) repeat protein